jgi:hypothetical protein
LPEKQKLVEVVRETEEKILNWIDSKLKHVPKFKPLTEIRTKKDVEQRANDFIKNFVPEKTKSNEIEERIRKRWETPLFYLEYKVPPIFVFYKHAHYGKLRGKSAAKICHRDLGRIGIKTRLTFKNDDAILEAD